MTEEQQRRHKAHPFNIANGYVGGLLKVNQNYCAVEMGSVYVINEGPILSVANNTVFGLRIIDGALAMSANLYTKEGELLAIIEDNEWISGDPLPWDIEAKWQRLTIREASNKIAIDLDARSIPPTLKGEFWHGGKHYKIGPDLNASNALTFRDLALVGIALNIMPNGTIKTGGGVIVSWPNKRDRLWKAKEAWQKMVAQRQSSQ